jgi:hypothetical protein
VGGGGCKLSLKKEIWNRRCTKVVPDRRVRNIPEVVLVRRWVSWGSGNLEGEGWVRVGKGVGQGGSVYKQPETEVNDSCHS